MSRFFRTPEAALKRAQEKIEQGVCVIASLLWYRLGASACVHVAASGAAPGEHHISMACLSATAGGGL